MQFSEEMKRWIGTITATYKLCTPVLRTFVAQEIQNVHASYDQIYNLKMLTFSQVTSNSKLKSLKFKNINNNISLHGNVIKDYDYSINSVIEFVKLFLPDYLVKKVSAFDETLDLSAILRLLGLNKPAPLFASPDPTNSIQAAADDVREEVRNKFSHFNSNEWTEQFFNDCFTKLETLIRSLGLSDGGKATLDQLAECKAKACQLCTVGQNLFSLVPKDMEQRIKDSIKRVEEQQSATQDKLVSLEKRCSSLEYQEPCKRARLDQHDERLDKIEKKQSVLVTQVEGLEKDVIGRSSCSASAASSCSTCAPVANCQVSQAEKNNNPVSESTGIYSLDGLQKEALYKGMQIKEMTPEDCPVKGGVLFNVEYEETIPEELDTAMVLIGSTWVEAEKSKDKHSFFGKIPPAPGEKPGIAKVLLYTPDLNHFLGEGQILYQGDDEVTKVLLKAIHSSKWRKVLFSEMAKRESGEDAAHSPNSSSAGLSSQGKRPEPVDVLMSLVDMAAETDGYEFLYKLFNSSAGKVVFKNYKNRSLLPGRIAKANGHNKTSHFLRETFDSFFKEEGEGEEQSPEIDWAELLRVFEVTQEELNPMSDGVEMAFQKDVLSKYIGDDEPLYSKESAVLQWLNCLNTVYEGPTPPAVLARGSRAAEAYRRALECGKTCDKRVRILLIGQERAGKTSLKRSLMGEMFNEHESKTQGVQIGVPLLNVGNKEWKYQADPVTTYFDHKCAELVAQELLDAADELVEEEYPTGKNGLSDRGKSSKGSSVPKGCPSRRNAASTEPLQSPEKSTTGFTEGCIATKDFLSNEMQCFKGLFDSKNLRSDLSSAPSEVETCVDLSTRCIQEMDKGDVVLIPPPVQGSVFNSDSEPPNNLPNEISNLVENALIEEQSTVSEERIWPVIWDFAGLPLYYATHPMFMSQKCIYLLVFDLRKNLFKKGDSCFERSRSGESSLDHLTNWLYLIHSIRDKSPVSCLGTTHPRVILVGTHADKVVGDPWEAMNAIHNSFQGKVFSEHILGAKFVVDNTRAGQTFQQEDPGVQRLREKIISVASTLPHTKREIPLRWLHVENVIQRLVRSGVKCVTKTEFKAITPEICDFEVDELLHFLCDRGSVFCLSDADDSSSLVILDPQWLIDVFHQMVSTASSKKEPMRIQQHRQSLARNCILSEELVSFVCQNLGLSLHPDSLISLLGKANLVCRWVAENDEVVYFVPAMLTTEPDEEITDQGPAAPIYLTFDSGYVPYGLFSRFLVLFGRWANQKHSTSPPKLVANTARFFFGKNDDFSLTYVCLGSVIRIHLGHEGRSEKEMEIALLLQQVCRCVHEILESLRQQCQWLRSMTWQLRVHSELHMLKPRLTDFHRGKQYAGSVALGQSKVRRHPRGICLIIHNKTNDHQGAEFDERELVNLFEELGFTVCVNNDLQRDEMLKVAATFTAKHHVQYDAFVFIVMSCYGDRDFFYGVDGRHTQVEDLMSEFKATNCPSLRNMQKLVFIQTCRGSSNERLTPAIGGASFSPDSTVARTVCLQEAFSTALGYEAGRYPQSGSWILVEATRNRHHLLDILTEVMKRMVSIGVFKGRVMQLPAMPEVKNGMVKVDTDEGRVMQLPAMLEVKNRIEKVDEGGVIQLPASTYTLQTQLYL